jgi:hypothetical protein
MARLIRTIPKKFVSKMSWGLLNGAFFRTACGDIEAGVVHQQVKAPFALDDFSDDRVDGFVTGDVQGEQFKRRSRC